MVPSATPTLASSADVAAAAAIARARGRLGIDTEFMSEGRYRALLCLTQVAVEHPDGPGGIRTILIDGLQEIDVAPLARLLADPAIEIVLHAGRQDVAILRRAWQTEVVNIFDTQIVAGFAGESAQAGYGNLIGAVLGERVGKTASFTRWDARPLTERAAELCGRGRRPPARAGRRAAAPTAEVQPARVGARGVPPARVSLRRTRSGNGLGAPAAGRDSSIPDRDRWRSDSEHGGSRPPRRRTARSGR